MIKLSDKLFDDLSRCAMFNTLVEKNTKYTINLEQIKALQNRGKRSYNTLADDVRRVNKTLLVFLAVKHRLKKSELTLSEIYQWASKNYTSAEDLKPLLVWAIEEGYLIPDTPEQKGE